MRKQILLCVLATALFFVGLPPLALAGDGPTVTITSLTPTLTSKTNQVRVRIQVKNPGAEPLREQTAAVSVMAASPLDANELAAWLRGSEDSQKQVQIWSGSIPNVPAHGEVSVEATIATDKIPATSDQWGPRGITASVGQAFDRSIMLVEAPFATDKSKLLLQVPVRGLRQDAVRVTTKDTLGKTGVGPASYVANDSIAEGNELAAGIALADTDSTRKLQELAKNARPGVVYLIDPACLDSGSPLSRGKTVGLEQPKYAAIPSASALAALKTISNKGGKILLTPWGFPAQRPSGTTRPLSLSADQRTAATAKALADRGIETSTNFAWFGAAPSLSQLQEVPAEWPILAPQNSGEPTSNLSYTPSARTNLYAKGDHPAILSSQSLAKTLAAMPQGNLTEFDLTQLALANVAIMNHERPFDPRIVSAELPPNANAAQTKRALALFNTGWSEPITLQEALSKDARADEYLPSGLEGAPTTSATDPIANVRTVTDLLSQVSDSPEKLTYSLQSQMLLAAGNTLPEPLRKNALRTLDSDAAALRNAVAAQPSSTINLISKEATLPVRISNALAIGVNVQAKARTSDPRLQVGKPQNMQVPAHSAATANIPLKAVGNGNIQVRVGIATRTGKPISQANPLHMRVRPGLEDKAILGAGGVVVAIFIFGLVRTFRRGRKMPVEEIP